MSFPRAAGTTPAALVHLVGWPGVARILAASLTLLR
jgi:hypothetical protein